MLYKGDSVDMDCDNIKGTPCGPKTKYIETELLVLGRGFPAFVRQYKSPKWD